MPQPENIYNITENNIIGKLRDIHKSADTG